MDVVLRELERMQRLLADVHCIARAPDRLEPVDVGALVDRLLPAWQVAAAGRGVEVTADAPRGLTLSGETLRIEVIATNLVKNAVEASRPGGRVRVTAGAGALIVEDEGEGLAPSLAGTLFTAGATTKPSGSGLGLFMSRRLASQLGGDLELENRAPRGCRATLTLTTPYPPQPRADA
jgi:signal transduction histidine kinase